MVDFAHARRQMVDTQIAAAGVTDRRLLAALGSVPREEFVSPSRRDFAYIDEPQALSEAPGRALGAPAPFAKLVQLAGVEHTDRVLDIGAATGYSTAVLAALAADVVAVEADEKLAALAERNLKTLGITNATVITAPLEAGARKHGPYDVIVVEGSVDAVPPALLEQLADDGRLVAVVRGRRTSVAHLFVKSPRDLASRSAFDASLPPLLTAAPVETFAF